MLNLSDKIKRDIDSNHITAYPIIRIYGDEDIYISTIKESIKLSEDGEVVVCKDYNLKISNIKESMDLKNHNFKISNVSITLNNYEQNNERLSDTLSYRINQRVDVFYKTPSCGNLDECLFLYRGIIRRVEHDDSTLKITLEDLTDLTFHKDVPIANLGTRKECFNKKYFNKYIPMLYGAVDKAPAIPYIDNVGSLGNYFISIITDDVEDVTGSGRGLNILGFNINEENPESVIFPIGNNDSQNPLHIYKGDYFRVLQKYDKSLHGDEDNSSIQYFRDGSEQYKIDTSFLQITKHYSSGFAQNPPAANEFQAVKLYHPSQAEILKTEVVGGDMGEGSAVVNIEADIFNPEASFDNEEKPSSILDGNVSNMFDTYSEIPYADVEIDEDTDSEYRYFVSNFRPCSWSATHSGIHCFPREKSYTGSNWDERLNMQTNYLWHVARWVYLNAHRLNGAVKFVSLPPGNMIRRQADLWISDPANGFALEGAEDFSIKGSGTSFSSQDGIGVRIQPQYQMTNRYRDRWAEACGFSSSTNISGSLYAHSSGSYRSSNEDGTLVRWDGDAGPEGWDISSGPNRSLPMFPVSGQDPTTGLDYTSLDWLAPRKYGVRFTNPDDAADVQNAYIYFTNKTVFDGSLALQPCYYPSALIKTWYDYEHPDNMPLEQEAGLEATVIGQWIPETMGPYSENGFESYSGGTKYYKFLNLFNDGQLDNDGNPIPYLFELDDFAVFTPLELTSKAWGSGVNVNDVSRKKGSIVPRYFCEWNGVEIGTYAPTGNYIGFTSGYVTTLPYADGYSWYEGKYDTSHNTDSNNPNSEGVSMREILGSSSGGGGQDSWFMYVTEDIPKELVMTDDMAAIEAFGDFGEWNPGYNGHGTIIKKGTLIPCNHWANQEHGGEGWLPSGYDFHKGSAQLFSDNAGSLTIQAGTTAANAEVRLGILYPFTNIDVNDALSGETSTFAFGKLEIDILSEGETEAEVNLLTTAGDKLVVQAYASDTIESSELNYNAEFVGGGGDFSATLIKILKEGDDDNFPNIFTDGGSVMWKSRNDSLEGELENENNVYENLDKYKIKAWDSPDKFDAISLAYRVLSTNALSRAQISSKVYSMSVLQFIMFDNALSDDFYVDSFGRVNNSDDLAEGSDGGVVFKYTGASWSGDYSSVSHVSNTADIIYHMIEKELGQSDIVNRESWETARSISSDINIGFSITDKINSKKLIEDICKNTRIYPKFSNSGEFSFKALKEAYSDSDVKMTIKQKDLIKFSFNRTPIEDVITMVNVKYKKDYAKNELTRQTGYVDSYDLFGYGDKVGGATTDIMRLEVNANRLTTPLGDFSTQGYSYENLGIQRDTNILEFESNYIRSYSSAEVLRNYILMQYCNQHTIVKCTLPLKYLSLEVGDVVRFDKLNNNTKAYNEDYTVKNIRNGQIIYPYFIITSISKSAKDIKIECNQLHELEPTFYAGLGSLTRVSERGVGIAGEYLEAEASEGNTVLGEDIFFSLLNKHFSFQDLNILEQMVVGKTSYATSMQKISADINKDNNINIGDINQIIIWVSEALGIEASTLGTIAAQSDLGTSTFSGTELTYTHDIGDINLDGIINVVDIVKIVSYILSNEYPNPESEEFFTADLNNDGVINIPDIVGVVNLVISG
tara:strand:- start:1294 stop:6204 length:4911 start_codon:yes stop_codon:yes gene_type:complete